MKNIKKITKIIKLFSAMVIVALTVITIPTELQAKSIQPVIWWSALSRPKLN